MRLARGRLFVSPIPDKRLHIARGGGRLFMLNRCKETAAEVNDFSGTGVSSAFRQVNLRSESATPRLRFRSAKSGLARSEP